MEKAVAEAADSDAEAAAEVLTEAAEAADSDEISDHVKCTRSPAVNVARKEKFLLNHDKAHRSIAETVSLSEMDEARAAHHIIPLKALRAIQKTCKNA